MRDGYCVIIEKHGAAILRIDSQMLSGKDPLSDDDLEAIRDAGCHLLSFAGPHERSPCFICGGVERCEPDCELTATHSSKPALSDG